MSITGKDLVSRGWPQGKVIDLAIAAGNAYVREVGATKQAILEVLDKVLRKPGQWTKTESFSELAGEHRHDEAMHRAVEGTFG